MSTEETPLFEKPPSDKESESELRIVLLGVVEEGKSSSGNMILSPSGGEKPFSTKCPPLAISRTIGRQRVVVVDTPGLSGIEISEEKVVEDLKKSISLTKYGPHVFLFVMRVNKFTKDHQDAVEIIERTFGKNIMAYTMVLFTDENKLKNQKMSIEQFIDTNSRLRDFIIQCNWRYHVFNLTDKNPDQVTDLLKKITHMIEMRRGTYYTTEMLQEAETALKQQQKQQQQQVQQQVQQQAQQQAQNQSGQNNTTRTAIGTFALFGTGAGSLMGFFFGGGEMTPPVGAALGAVAGGLIVAGTTGLTVLAKNAFHKCCGKNSDCF
ncbi:GTPase IMAP family member 7-like isoform X1 [Lates japonicus]